MAKGDWLYLFSSNASPQYAQDILNVLAGADGQHYVFRYEDRWVDEETQLEWAKLAQNDTWVLVCFSLQQQAAYQDAAFIPVRLGRVVKTHSIGPHYFVTFSLGRYVSLPAPDGDSDTAYAARVRTFTTELATRCTTPYDASACVGRQLRGAYPTPWVDVASDQALLFQRTTEYLCRTQSFQDARFLRFEDLVPRGQDGPGLTLDGAPLAFTLQAGQTYELRLVQSQPRLVTDRSHFTVATDGTILTLMGEPGFDIASSYDEILVDVHAAVPSQFGVNETVIIVEPQAPGGGPRIEVPCRVVSSARKAAVVTTLTTLGLIIVGLQAVLPFSGGTKAGLVIVGALLAAYMQMYGLASPSPTSF